MSNTANDCRDTVRMLAAEAFTQHALTERRPWVWKCARPQQWAYGFFLLIAPGAVIIYGDLGEAIFRMAAGSEADVLDWVLRCSSDPEYVLSKLQPREAWRQFYPGDAIAYATGLGNVDLVETLKEYDGYYGGVPAHVYYEACQERGLNDLPDCNGWTAGAHWIYHALSTFARLHKAQVEA